MFLKKLFKKKDPKVAIVAIAKNESLYLADWIHHHLYFGFQGIFVGINRTTDRSEAVLGKIKEKHDRVHFYNMDWVDSEFNEIRNPQLQPVAYKYLTEQVLESKTNVYTHILYIDIDEFWFCADFTSTINNYIKSLPNFDAVSFNWLLQEGDEFQFSQPFKNLACRPTCVVKTLISRDLTRRIALYKPHHPTLVESNQRKYLRYDSNGQAFAVGENDSRSDKVPDVNSSAFILHRTQRSEVEYLALLRRERPSSEVPVKNNRWGFCLSETKKINISSYLLDKYWCSLCVFIDECTISDLIIEAEKETINLAKNILEVEPAILAKYAAIYEQVLDGTYMQEKILTILEKSQESIINDSNAPVFLKCAIFYQLKKKNLTALGYINLAVLSRPKGPMILSKLNELRKDMKM